MYILKFLVPTVILFISVEVMSTSIKKMHGYELFQDVVIETDTPISVMSSDTLMRCLHWCLTADNCLSLFYNSLTLECRLNAQTYQNTFSGLFQVGWVYYNTTRDLKTNCLSAGYNYVESNDWCYRLYRSKVTYSNAAKQCKADGAHIVKIDGMAENNDVMSVINAHAADFASDKTSFLFIQGQRSSGSSPWLYDDGTPMDFFKWYSGQPNDELFIVICTPYFESIMPIFSCPAWHDIDDFPNAFICEIS